MSSVRETALQALFVVLKGVAGVTVKRGEILPVKIPDNGLIILFDGEVTVAEMLLSPLRYLIQHRAEVQVSVQKTTASARNASLDGILTLAHSPPTPPFPALSMSLCWKPRK
jgi:hypothetical protein